MNKLNPRRRPCSQADVNRAKKSTQEEAVSYAQVIFLSVLTDKECADKETIQRVWNEINERSDSIAKGYVNLFDLRRVLNEEYDIKV